MTRCARVPIAQQLAPFSMACPMHGHGGTVQTAVNVVTTEEPRTVSYARIGLDEAGVLEVKSVTLFACDTNKEIDQVHN